MRKFTKNQPRTSYEDLSVDGTFRRDTFGIKRIHSEDTLGTKRYARKTMGFFTNSWKTNLALESHFEEHAKEVWEINRMNPELADYVVARVCAKIDGNDSEGTSCKIQRESSVECSSSDCRPSTRNSD